LLLHLWSLLGVERERICGIVEILVGGLWKSGLHGMVLIMDLLVVVVVDQMILK
jgi:hypothetical protein